MRKTKTKWSSIYFYGNKISDEGLRQNRLDYRTLASAFNHVLCNDILKVCYNAEIISDYIDEEIFQYYIIDDNGAEIIKEFTDDPLFYIEELDLYVWGVTHWGTSWDYVMTDVELEITFE